MKVLNKYILAIILFPTLCFSQEYNYEIDEEHFSLGFLVEHAGYAKTLGMFRKINGDFIHDDKQNQITNVKIIVDTSSVYTNHEKRDSHLRSPDFLDVGKFPQMIFTADNIKITDNGIIPLKERVAGAFYDPLAWLLKNLTSISKK